MIQKGNKNLNIVVPKSTKSSIFSQVSFGKSKQEKSPQTVDNNNSQDQFSPAQQRLTQQLNLTQNMPSEGSDDEDNFNSNLGVQAVEDSKYISQKSLNVSNEFEIHDQQNHRSLHHHHTSPDGKTNRKYSNTNNKLFIKTQQKQGEKNDEEFIQPFLSEENRIKSEISIKHKEFTQIKLQNEKVNEKEQEIEIENEKEKEKEDEQQSSKNKTNLRPLKTKTLDGGDLKLKNLNSVWKQGGLRIILFVKKAHHYFLNLSRSYKFKRISKNQLHILGDLSSDYNFFFFNGYLNTKPTCIGQTINHLLYTLQKVYNMTFNRVLSKLGYKNRAIVLNPESYTKILWDIFIFVLLFSNIFYVPIKIAFQYDRLSSFNPPTWLQLFLNDIPSWAFLSDIFINFITCYYEKGILITEIKKISKHYLKTNFLWDFIVILPFFIRLVVDVPYIQVILLLRINKMTNTVKRFQENMHYRESDSPVYDMTQLVFLILFVAHFCGCSFCWLHVLEYENDPYSPTWITVLKIHDSDWVVKYITSVYWAVITMITVGYGDITPVTMYEKGFMIVMSLVACGVFAYSVNCIGTIFQDLSKKNQELKEKMHLAIKKMKKRNLEHSLIMKVRRYFQYKMEMSKDQSEDDLFILNQLDKNLKKEVLTDINFKILKQKKIFSNNFSSEFLLKLAPKLKEAKYSPEQLIFKKGDMAEKVYFLVEGEAALTLPILASVNSGEREVNKEQSLQKSYTMSHKDFNSNVNENDNDPTSNTMKQVQVGFQNIKLLYEGDMFGQESFFTEEVLHYQAISLTSVSVICLKKSDFISTLRDFKTDYEKYCLLRDNIIINNRATGLDFKCFSCEKFDHGIQKCPVITYVPPTDKFLAILNRSENQEREEFQRRDYRSENSLSDMAYLKETMVQFIIDEDVFPNLNEMVEKIKLIEDPPNDNDSENADDENKSVKTTKTSKTNKTSKTTQSYERRERENAQQKRGEGQRRHHILIRQPSGIQATEEPATPFLEAIDEDSKNQDTTVKTMLRPPENSPKNSYMYNTNTSTNNNNNSNNNSNNNNLNNNNNNNNNHLANSIGLNSPGLSAMEINQEFKRKHQYENEESQGVGLGTTLIGVGVGVVRSEREIAEQIVNRKVNKIQRNVFDRSISKISNATSQNDIDTKTVKSVIDDNLLIDYNQKDQIARELNEEKKMLRDTLLNGAITHNVLNVTDSFDVDLLCQWSIYQPMNNIHKIIQKLRGSNQTVGGIQRGITIKNDIEQINQKQKEEMMEFKKNFKIQSAIVKSAIKQQSTIRAMKQKSADLNSQSEMSKMDQEQIIDININIKEKLDGDQGDGNSEKGNESQQEGAGDENNSNFKKEFLGSSEKMNILSDNNLCS